MNWKVISQMRIWNLRSLDLDDHENLSDHEYAARKRSMEKLRRITVIVPAEVGNRFAGRSSAWVPLDIQ